MERLIEEVLFRLAIQVRWQVFSGSVERAAREVCKMVIEARYARRQKNILAHYKKLGLPTRG